MHKLIGTAIAIAALTTTGLAVAHRFDSKSVKDVSATFTATTAGNVASRTCTGADGTYTKTNATYTGTAISTEPSLNGPLTVYAESLVNTTTGVGIVRGKLRIGSGDSGTNAHFETVLANGNVAGTAEGDHLLGNLSAGYTTAGGFTTGKLGGGTSGGDAVLVQQGGCEPTPTPKPDRIDVHGAITGFTPATGTPTAITVANVTCNVPTELQSAVGALHVGDRVEMTCTVSGTTNTLAKITPGDKEAQAASKHDK